MFQYAGIVFALCYLHQFPGHFLFAPFVWRSLTGLPLEIEDVYITDRVFQRTIKGILGCDDSQELATYCDGFQVETANGTLVPLIPDGATIPLSLDRRSEYVELAIKYRIDELKRPLDAVKKGFYQFFSESVSRLFVSWEMELIIAGPREVAVERLTECSECDQSEDSSRLWKVLGEMTNEYRLKFITFVTGRSGLPMAGMPMDKIKISWNTDDTSRLPQASTCFSRVSMPRYPSDDLLKQKLVAAIGFGLGHIEDGGINAAELARA
jgi:hypothetical protein